MLNFTPAANTNGYSGKQNMSLPLTTFRAGAVYIMKKRDRKNLFPEICVTTMNYSVISHTLSTSLLPQL